MKIIKPKGLFWKIFLAFWITCVIIILATTFLVAKSMEEFQFKEKHKRNAEEFALYVIDHYEEKPQKLKSLKKSLQRNDPRSQSLKRRFKFDRPIQIAVRDNIIFEHRPRALRKLKIMEFSTIGASGKPYIIRTAIRPPPRFLVLAMQRLKTMQFVLMLVASALVSLALSWSITRPLKRIGTISRNYANNELCSGLEEDLLFRGDEIGDLARDFNFMIKQVEKNIQSQKQLMHDVSHELRAPLARIQAAAALISQRNTKEIKLIDQLDKECLHIDCLIQKILEFSHIGQQTNKPMKIDLSDIIKQQLDNLKLEFPHKKIQYFNNEGPVITEGYEELINSAIENVLRNACKYTPIKTPIDINIKADNDMTEVSIRDYGPGILNHEKEKLLQPFFRSGNKMHTDGFGLGLSITQKAIEQHGGKLELNNHAKGGLHVKITLKNSLGHIND